MMRVIAIGAVFALITGASPAMAQQARIELVPSTGYMMFGDVLRGPIGTSLSNSNGPMFGAQLNLPVAGPVSMYLGGAYASSEMQVGIPVLGGITVGDTDAWLGDAGLELRSGSSTGVRPFVQAGIGAIHYRIQTGPLDLESTSLAVAGGVGVDVPIGKTFGLRIMAKDYIGRFDFEEATALDIESRTAHNVALSVGVRLGF
jgi:hypothetical protein